MRALSIVSVCLLAACSDGGGEEKKKADAPAAAMEAGQWESAFEVRSIRSTDKTEPVLKVKAGDKETGSACIAAGSEASPPGELFAGPGYTCRTQTAYNRNGRINSQYKCNRAGIGGEFMMTVQGKYTGTTFDGTVDTLTYLSGNGDFDMSRTVTARKTGASCAAAAPAVGTSGMGGG